MTDLSDLVQCIIIRGMDLDIEGYYRVELLLARLKSVPIETYTCYHRNFAGISPQIVELIKQQL